MRTDFVLSAEIIAVTLGTVADVVAGAVVLLLVSAVSRFKGRA